MNEFTRQYVLVSYGLKLLSSVLNPIYSIESGNTKIHKAQVPTLISQATYITPISGRSKLHPVY